MKYAVFIFSKYYPSGGWNDLILMTDDLQLAVDTILAKYVKYEGYYETDTFYEYNHSHIVDMESKEIICEDEDILTFEIKNKS